MEMGRDDEALTELSAAVPVFREMNSLNSLAISLAQTGEILMKKGLTAKAAEAFDECVAVCVETDNIYIESRGQNGLYQLYKDADVRKAITHLERYVELQAALNNDKANEQMQAFNVKYESLKKEQTILMQRQKLTWAGILVAMLLILLAMSGVAIALKIRSSKETERKNAMLVKANIDKDRLLALVRNHIPDEAAVEVGDVSDPRTVLPEINLTDRQIEIAELCAQGMISKEIAVCLGISQRTVEVHKNNIFRKLGINNTVELMRYMQMRFADKQ